MFSLYHCHLIFLFHLDNVRMHALCTLHAIQIFYYRFVLKLFKTMVTSMFCSKKDALFNTPKKQTSIHYYLVTKVTNDAQFQIKSRKNSGYVRCIIIPTLKIDIVVPVVFLTHMNIVSCRTQRKEV
jgi:hypothetical protein